MIRGTTAQFKFELPCMANELESATIVFWQEGIKNDYLPIKKNLTHCSMEGKYLYVSLTDSETFMFSDKLKARVQLKAEYNGTVFASRQQLVTVYPLNDVSDKPPAPNENGWAILDGGSVTN